MRSPSPRRASSSCGKSLGVVGFVAGRPVEPLAGRDVEVSGLLWSGRLIGSGELTGLVVVVVVRCFLVLRALALSLGGAPLAPVGRPARPTPLRRAGRPGRQGSSACRLLQVHERLGLLLQPERPGAGQAPDRPGPRPQAAVQDGRQQHSLDHQPQPGVAEQALTSLCPRWD